MDKKMDTSQDQPDLAAERHRASVKWDILCRPFGALGFGGASFRGLTPPAKGYRPFGAEIPMNGYAHQAILAPKGRQLLAGGVSPRKASHITRAPKGRQRILEQQHSAPQKALGLSRGSQWRKS
jgi:hypothetical protein